MPSSFKNLKGFPFYLLLITRYLEPIRKLVMSAQIPEDQSASEVNESEPINRLLCPASA